MQQPAVRTRSQEWAELAYNRVSKRAAKEETREEYARFAKRFPSLIHTCGLAQALAFAQAKAPAGFIDDLESMFREKDLAGRSRTEPVTEYLRLTRMALEAAGWLKRYAEALLDDEGGGRDASVSR